ncbi:hypothetical protein GVO57_09330 [Sphingomonas changnyeongensis]|uniref:Uncharacterized protein n=1 Tax=Sphingomonas changnyeongensis TaxID=2698679 RepID=A0A7Z2NW75_9SPHN|nr:hypothetical protein [Sphingomonas changnyeongensis]QHL90983.1 hypothetical protein GVO57_09330 [Sphingomonas changnyeongensis]
MTQDDRVEWLAAAADALREYPADLLRIGIAEARKRADHPSKIIPAVVGHVEELLIARRRELQRARDAASPPAPALPTDGSRHCSAEDAREILERYGFKSSVPATTVERGPRRLPTVDDYVALGVSRDVAEKAVADRRARCDGSPAPSNSSHRS